MVDAPLINTIGQSAARQPGDRSGPLAVGDPVEVACDTYAACGFGTLTAVAGVRPAHAGQGELYEVAAWPGLLFWRAELARRPRP